VGMAHLGLNLLDDYFDYKGGAVQKRQELQEGGMRARMGKCAYLSQGVTLEDTRRTATLLIALALVLGVVVLVLRGWPIAVFALLTLVLGLAYAGPPLRLSYHGLGELVTGIIFGPLVVIAAYYVALGRIDAVAVWASVPAGLLTINILNAHAIMDFESDKAADRMTMVVLLGTKQAGLVLRYVLLALSYASVIVAVALGAFSPVALAVLVTVPMAIGFARLLRQYVVAPDEPVVFKRWMGPMGDTAMAQKLGVDWFAIRWRLARNLLMAFVLIVALANGIRW
ncbi:MAG: prenyltransferase, partial [Coriobacteriales bacterium]|nr:prenyltransferase [Coriobacteriales bacterium]